MPPTALIARSALKPQSDDLLNGCSARAIQALARNARKRMPWWREFPVKCQMLENKITPTYVIANPSAGSGARTIIQQSAIGATSASINLNGCCKSACVAATNSWNGLGFQKCGTGAAPALVTKDAASANHAGLMGAKAPSGHSRDRPKRATSNRTSVAHGPKSGAGAAVFTENATRARYATAPVTKAGVSRGFFMTNVAASAMDQMAPRIWVFASKPSKSQGMRFCCGRCCCKATNAKPIRAIRA